MPDLISARLEVDDDFEAVQSLYLERGWTDGLPVVPPTTERVAAMLAATPLSPQDVIGEIPPNWGSATVEKLLREKYEIADVIHWRKPTASLPAEDSVLDEMAGSVQAVIVGLAD